MFCALLIVKGMVEWYSGVERVTAPYTENRITSYCCYLSYAVKLGSPECFVHTVQLQGKGTT